MSPVGRLIITDGVVVTGDGRVLPGATVVVQGTRVQEIRVDGSRPDASPSDWRIDADGRLVTPGLVDLCLCLPEAPERAAAVLMESLLLGTTGVLARVPSHATSELADYVSRLGMRMILAVEADLRAPQPALDAAQAAEDRGRTFPDRIWPALAIQDGGDLGALAELTGAARTAGWPVMLAAAADQGDLGGVFGRFGRRPVERLDEAGALGPGTLVHGHVLDAAELDLLARTGSALVCCARAAWRRNVVPPLDRARERGTPVALGTGSEGPGVVAEAVLTHLLTRGTSAGEPEVLVDAFAGGARVLSSLVQAPLGQLVPGALADVVVHGWRPARPFGPAWFLDMPWGGAAAWVVVGGEVVLREGRLLGADVSAVARRSREL